MNVNKGTKLWEALPPQIYQFKNGKINGTEWRNRGTVTKHLKQPVWLLQLYQRSYFGNLDTYLFSIDSGGIDLTITGEHMDSVAVPLLEMLVFSGTELVATFYEVQLYISLGFLADFIQITKCIKILF